MSSKLKAGTASSGAVIDADTTGILELQTGSTPTTAVTVDASQNVGIGTSSPAGKRLYVLGGGAVIDQASVSGSTLILNRTSNPGSLELQFGGTQTAQLSALSGGGLNFYTGSTPTERMRISSGGNLLVGTTSVPNAGNAIACFGGFYSFCLNSGSFNYYFGTDGNNFNVYSGDGVLRGYLGTAGAWTNTSDIVFKKDIVDIKYSLQDALNLRPVSYLTKDYEIPQIGFIAQEMEQVIPEVVSGKEGSKGISYGSLVALCVKAIQDLNAKVDAQATTIAELQARLPAENT